jgi:hypothetical protein
MFKFYKLICLLITLFIPFFVSAASLSLSPSDGEYEVGDVLVVKIIVSGDKSLNAISSTILVPTSFFTIQSVSKNSSILDFWVTEPSFDRTAGTVNFEGVALSGFKGESGVVATMKLKPIKTGTGRVLFQLGKILANDGEGTLCKK